MVERIVVARLFIEYGNFTCVFYKNIFDGYEYVVFLYGEYEGDVFGVVGEDMFVCVYSECLIGDIFKSARCDCGN